MRQFRSTLAVALVLASSMLVAPAALAEDAPALSARDFEDLHALIRPGPGESRWMEIDWHPSVHEARKKAAAAGKPIFIMAGSGGAPAAGC